MEIPRCGGGLVHYACPYISAQTGSFATESELPAKLLWMRDNHTSFAPRDWAFANMNCHLATQVVAHGMRAAASDGEPWTVEPAVKVTHLNTMAYARTIQVASTMSLEPKLGN